MDDSKRLRSAYRNFYPSKMQAMTSHGAQTVLCMQGFSNEGPIQLRFLTLSSSETCC